MMTHIVPEGFFITASSPSCRVQGMENLAGDRFGLQFHPEVNDSDSVKRCSKILSKYAVSTEKITNRLKHGYKNHFTHNSLWRNLT